MATSAKGVATSPVRSSARSAALSASGPGVWSSSRVSSSTPRSSNTSASSASKTSSLQDYWNQLSSITASNNAWSAAQAEKQMQFQSHEAEIARQFNADQAQLDRQWQEMMSNTSHQREVKDLMAAGLNPVLSATGGAPVTSGASASQSAVPAGAKGDTDTSMASAMASIIGSVMSAQASILNTATSAQTSERIAQLQSDTSIAQSQMSAKSAMDVERLRSSTSLSVAQIGYRGQVDSSYIHKQATIAAAQISGQYNLSVAQTNQVTQLLTHSMDNLARSKENALDRISSETIAAENRRNNIKLKEMGIDGMLLMQQNSFTHELEMSWLNLGQGLIADAGGRLLSRAIPTYGEVGSLFGGLGRFLG